MTDDVDPKRRLQIQGTYNMRDLGGYVTQNGRRTRWGRLVRADSLHRLTSETSLQPILDYGIRTVIDLRKSRELQTLSNPFFGSDQVTYYHQNLTGDVHLRELADIPASAELVEAKRRTYPVVLDQRRSQVRETLSLLALPDSLPALFHCSAGADRTGLIAALVLGIAGVPQETIAEDYALSGRFLLARHLDDNPDISADDMTWQEYERQICPPDIILDALQDLEDRHGGIVGYAHAVGLSDAEIESIREAMVE
jgi:protein-tyrosine phosphatase